MKRPLAVASGVIGQRQHHFLASFLAVLLVLDAWLGSQLQANAQQEYGMRTNEGYKCSDSGKTSCNTFVLYRAQVTYSTIPRIAELFNKYATEVAELNQLSAEHTLDKGHAVFIPVTCRCVVNSISFSNISYKIESGDFYYNINAINYEFLSTEAAIEAANSKLPIRGLVPNQMIVIPVRCACPSKAQISKGVKLLVTYPVKEGEPLAPIASTFGVSWADIIDANTLSGTADNPRVNGETTILIPIKSTQLSYGPLPIHNPETPPGEAASGGDSDENKGGGSSEGSSHRIMIYVSVVIALAFAVPVTNYIVRNINFAKFSRPRSRLTWDRMTNGSDSRKLSSPTPSDRSVFSRSMSRRSDDSDVELPSL